MLDNEKKSPKDIAGIEALISNIERKVSPLVEVSFFEQILHLRELLMHHWKDSDPEVVDTPKALATRDKIVFIEQRMISLVARVPAYSAENIKVKLQLLMYGLDLNEVHCEDDDPTEHLIKSLNTDIRLLAENEKRASFVNGHKLKTAS